MTSNETATAADPYQPRVAIIGIGYAGLPLAVGFAVAGCPVVCHDVDPFKVDSVNAGRSYLPDVSDDDIVTIIRFSAVKT